MCPRACWSIHNQAKALHSGLTFVSLKRIDLLFKFHFCPLPLSYHALCEDFVYTLEAKWLSLYILRSSIPLFGWTSFCTPIISSIASFFLIPCHIHPNMCVYVCVCGGSDLTFASCVSHFHELTKSPVSLCLHLSVHSCVLELLQSLLLL